MSANPENQVLDLQQVTPIQPPDKVKPAAKKASPSNKRPTPPRKSEADIRAELEADFAREEEMRVRIRAELEAEYKAKLAQATPVVADASGEDLDETPYVHVVPDAGEQVIHMVEDGLTVGTRVYYRGEELALDPEQHPWIKYSRKAQLERLGKHYFAQGPWPYGGYDLTDENLSPDDKRKLLRATESYS